MARPSPSCAHGDDRVRLPPASPTRDAPESGRIVLALSFRLVDPLRTKQATITLLQEEIANEGIDLVRSLHLREVTHALQ